MKQQKQQPKCEEEITAAEAGCETTEAEAAPEEENTAEEADCETSESESELNFRAP